MNTTTVRFTNSQTAVAMTPLWQYDYGQRLIIEGLDLPTAYEVHFCNAGDSTTTTQIGDADGVIIPDTYFLNGKDILAYIYLHTGLDDGETEYKITILVRTRQRPTDLEPTPVQQDAITQAIAALNNAVDETAQSATESADSAAAALESEQAAKASEDAAALSERNAAASASAASNSASASAASASASADSARESASSASAAASSATNAGASATAAASSATAASNAQTAAETAQGKAEDAQTAAEDAAASVSASAAQITQNTEDVADLKSAFGNIGYEIGSTPIQIETLADGRYWLSNGTNSWGTSPAYLVSKSVQLHSGDTLVYSAYGVSAASMMTEVSASGNEITSGAHILFGDNVETPLTGTYKADRDMLVQFSFNKTKDYQFSLSSFKKTSFDYMLMMKTIGVIGDSLASGEIAYTESGTDHYVDRYDGSWLSEICRTIGATPTHYSRGGMTAKAWFEDAGSYKSQLQTDGALNAYYLALGTNDISESYPIGTTADTAGTDSFVGYMRSIIEYVHGIAPYAPIFLVSTYGTNANHATYSNMISSIAGLYDYCYFVDYKNNADIFTSTGGVWSNLGHFTSVGYVKVADKIKTLTNAIISDNLADFKFYTLYT